MTTTALAAWFLAVMTALVPPTHATAAPTYPGWAETVEARGARYTTIAWDAAIVINDEGERAGPGLDARHSGALALAVADHESLFAPDVDLGPCYRGPTNAWPRCDHGESVSLWQVRAANAEERDRYQRDRQAALREALRRMRRSLWLCRHLPREERLALYASGDCERGHQAAREIDAIYRRVLAMPVPVPAPAAEVTPPALITWREETRARWPAWIVLMR